MRLAALAIGLIALGATRLGYSAESIHSSKIVDLTYTFDDKTIYWPTEKGFVHEFEKYGETAEHYFYSSAKYVAPEHGGTHTDAPIHFNEHGITLDQVPLADCIGPAAVIDFSARAASNPDATLSVDDIKAYESANGAIPDGAIVVARSGWGKYWPDRKRYMGTDIPDDVAGLHFPGFSPEAANYLLTNRKVAAIAIDTASIDPGTAADFPVHRIWLGANKPGFENVANADRLPPKGATIFCIPMKIGKGTGGPTRIFAVLP
ncbi:MAG: cyclase family protein [Candidatus Binatus sp.]|uniref:cyclase family protein n=1 Tax=Candidatus Binatus sp. TaxID=2811406 RepID=UPI00271EBD26|nr:cyclase family protein [Candidatus Binatus sp.]MDO8433978.1 cyclase family protein [Candidatus Binatus sp.]